MPISIKRSGRLAASLLVLSALSVARAGDNDIARSDVSLTSGVTNATGVTEVSNFTVTSPTAFSGAAPVDSQQLDVLRGGTEMTSNDMTLRGTVGANIASDVVTGVNSISAGSFAYSSGIPIVIQNSGANVLIQNATIINLQMH